MYMLYACIDVYTSLLCSGKREWAIENHFVSSAEEIEREIPNVETRLLKGFVAHQSWIMNPGDMLYIPPRVPHRGIDLALT